jgi:hypothetical protein
LPDAAGTSIVAASIERFSGFALCRRLPLLGALKGQEKGNVTRGPLEPIHYWRKTGLEPYGESTGRGDRLPE